MKKFLLAAGCMAMCAVTFGSEILIKNGSFENKLTGWIVPGWIKNAATPILDSSDMPGPGTASLKLVAENGKLPIVFQNIKFPANIKQYKISFKAKTEKINDWGFVILYVSANNVKKRCFEQIIGAGKGVKNSTPWTTYSGVIDVPAEALGKTGKITVQFGSKCTGTAWFDDIIVEPVKVETPQSASAPAAADKKK